MNWYTVLLYAVFFIFFFKLTFDWIEGRAKEYADYSRLHRFGHEAQADDESEKQPL